MAILIGIISLCSAIIMVVSIFKKQKWEAVSWFMIWVLTAGIAAVCFCKGYITF